MILKYQIYSYSTNSFPERTVWKSAAFKSPDATRNIPVIIVSASPNLDKQAKAAGADGLIEKPFTMKYLLELLRKYI